jgi:hypothetical protein
MAYQKMDDLFDSETVQTNLLKGIKFEKSLDREETFAGDGSSIVARPLAG